MKIFKKLKLRNQILKIKIINGLFFNMNNFKYKKNNQSLKNIYIMKKLNELKIFLYLYLNFNLINLI